MPRRNATTLPVDESWDAYWRSAGYNAAYSSDGISHPAIRSFWDQFFQTVKAEYAAPRIIDIASGNGTVVECAESAYGGQLPDFTCLDISAPAISALERRYPSVRTVAADARQIPLDSAGYDIATSQFGIEYAGPEAIDEVARLVAPGGRLAFLLHNRAGSIYRECVASLDAIERVQQAEFIPRAAAMFDEGFAACRGAERAGYEAAATRLAPAVRALESIMVQHGTHVAGDLVVRLYDDVATIHEHIRQYDASEVLTWLGRLDGELQAVTGRMASMCAAAIDGRTFDRLCDGLRRQAFTAIRAEALAEPDRQTPLAWALIAVRD